MSQNISLPEAEDLLLDAELVVGSEGGIQEIRSLQQKCLEAGIPALVGPCSKQG